MQNLITQQIPVQNIKKFTYRGLLVKGIGRESLQRLTVILLPAVIDDYADVPFNTAEIYAIVVSHQGKERLSRKQEQILIFHSYFQKDGEKTDALNFLSKVKKCGKRLQFVYFTDFLSSFVRLEVSHKMRFPPT